MRYALLPRAQARSLSRLRGRAGVGVPPQSMFSVRREPSPAALFERVDLSRKRERCTDLAACLNPS